MSRQRGRRNVRRLTGAIQLGAHLRSLSAALWCLLGALFVLQWTPFIKMDMSRIGALLLVGAAMADGAGRWLQDRSYASLSEIEEVEALGPLVDLLDLRDSDIVSATILSLTRILPDVGHVHSERMTDRQWDRLYDQLLHADLERRATFLLTILRTAWRLEDTRALPAVQVLFIALAREEEELVRFSAATSGAMARSFEHSLELTKELRGRTAVCLKSLETAEERAKAQGHLLRPAEAPDDTLLRPATRVRDSAPELLLHTVEQNEPDD